MIDCHAHILPGLDDGPEDGRTCYAMCQRAAADGVRHIIATPHHGNGLYTAPPAQIRGMVAKLNDFLCRKGLELTVHPGCEAHLSYDLIESVENGQTLTLCGGRYLLLEMPMQELPSTVERFVFDCMIRDIQPILAHPERIAAVQRDPFSLAPLVRSGALVQLTAQSLTGDFGPEPQECAETLLRHQLAHIIASDAHSLNRRPPVLSEAVLAAAEILDDVHQARRMVQDIPEMILRGEAYEPPAPIDPVYEGPSRRSLWAMVRCLF